MKFEVGAIAQFTQEGDQYDGLRVRILSVHGIYDVTIEILTGTLTGTMERWNSTCFGEVSALEQLAEVAE